MVNVFFKTYGCSANQADTNLLKSYIKNHNIVENLKDSDIVIVNSCIVKEPTENKVISYIKKIKENKKVILVGCMAEALPTLKTINDINKVNFWNYNKIELVIDKTIKNQRIDLLSHNNKSEHYFRIKDYKNYNIKRNNIIDIIVIGIGCLGSCNFCITKLARKNLVSRRIQDILKDLKNTDAREVWLTSQDNGCYGFDLGYNLIDLLNSILDIKDEINVKRIRIGMANPNYLVDLKKDLVKVMKDNIFFKFLHIPVQSGSNKILKLMNRDYNVEDFIELVNYLKSRINDISISTDIITGYFNETDNDFKESINLIKKIKPDFLNISRFWPRKHTLDFYRLNNPNLRNKFNFDKIIAKERSKQIYELFQKISYDNNKKYVNKELNVIVDEIDNFNNVIGRTDNYKSVIIKNNNITKESYLNNLRNELGNIVKVKINESTKLALHGYVV